jgi:hypothetical protein
VQPVAKERVTNYDVWEEMKRMKRRWGRGGRRERNPGEETGQ